MPRKSAGTNGGQGSQPSFPEWERLTGEQQQALIEILQEAAQEIRDQYEEELNLLNRHAAAGAMLARRDGSGLSRQPVPPVPDVKRDAPFERLALDSHRLATVLAYLEALLAHLIAQGFDTGVELSSYLAARTEGLAEGRVKALARTLEEQGRGAYTSLYSWVVSVFPELTRKRVLEWDEQARQQDSWVDRLRRMLAGE